MVISPTQKKELVDSVQQENKVMLIPDILGYGLICYFVIIPIAAVITACRRSEELKEIRDKIEALAPNSYTREGIRNLLYSLNEVIATDRIHDVKCKVTSVLNEMDMDQKELLKRLKKHISDDPFKHQLTKPKKKSKSPTKKKV